MEDQDKRPRKDRWLKHYNEASQGDTLQQFLVHRDYECIVLFWYLLEYLSRNDDEERSGKGRVKVKYLASQLHMKPSKIRRVLARFVSVSWSWNCVCTEEELSYLVPNWRELQENRGGKRTAKKEQKTHRSKKKEVRSKIYSETDVSLPDFKGIWNGAMKNLDLPKVKEPTEARLKKIKTFLKEKTEQDFEAICAKVVASDFLSGRSGKWKASFDWCINLTNAQKILEGNYDNNKNTQNLVPLTGGW